MYSCNPNHENQKDISDSSKARLCRFSGRYDNLHQKAGCDGCTRGWDYTYLKSTGLVKSEVQE